MQALVASVECRNFSRAALQTMSVDVVLYVCTYVYGREDSCVVGSCTNKHFE